MSDDFDKLRPTGDEDDSDDESLDWKQDKSKKPGQPASGDDLGFTGELTWRKDVDDAFSEQMAAANEDAFDWQQKQQDKGGNTPSSSGFTGELDWKKAQQSGDMPDAGEADESLDWLRSADNDEPAPAEDDDPFANLTTPPAAEEPEAEADPLAWMDQYGTNVTDEPAAPAASFMDEDEDIFATAPDQLDAPADQDDPLSWLNQFSATDEKPAEPTSPASAASWLDDDLPDDAQGSDAAAPSWLDEPEDIVPADAGDADVPPWLSEAAPTEKPITEGGKLSADWLAGAEDAPASAEADMSFDDWQRIQDDLTRPRDLEDEMPDLYSEMSGAPPVNEGDLPTSDTGQLPSWVLGMDELNADNAPDWMTQDQPEQTSSPSVPDDIFAELGLPGADTGYNFPDDDDPLAGLNLGGDETPDWLQESSPSASSPASTPSASAPDDIFAELGISAPATGYDFLDNPDDDDPLAGLDLGGSNDSPDWFTETAPEPAASDTPDWLQDLGDLSQAAEATTMDMSAGAGIAPAEDDFLAELRGESRQPAAEIDPTDTSGLQDIDSLLASYDDAMALPDTGELMGSGGDNIMDRLLSNEDLEQISARRAPDPHAHPSAGTSGLSPDAPEWLTELGANVDEVSAAAIVRKQTQRERPLDELTDRLQALHDRGMEMPTSEESKPSEVLRTLLPGVTEVLPAAPLQVTQSGLVGDLVLTGAQREKINLLKSLVGTDESEHRAVGKPSAIDLTLATPNFSDMDVDEEPDLGGDGKAVALPAPVSVRARKRRRLPKIDRLLIAVFLAVAVILPYVVNSLRIGDLPPAQFAAGSREATAFATVDGLHRGDLALIAVEYGPTGAGELDPTLDALLRHTLMRGARPVIVSGNPVGLLHARNVLNKIIADAGFLRLIDRPSLRANRDYYVIRYLAASTIGLRAFSQDLPQMLAVDVDGQATSLATQSIQEFSVIAVVAESAEELRGWAEQVAPLAGKALVAATGQSAAPLSEPYVLAGSPQILSGLSGLLVGYKDAYTYRSMLDARLAAGGGLFIPPSTTPSFTPTTETPAVTPTLEGGATTEITPTEGISSPTPEGARPTNTLPPTEQPTNTPAPTSTATDTPTATFTPSITPTFEPAVAVRGVIDSNQSVNVREGPGRTFAPVGSLSPGAIVQIIGRNGDGTWLKVKMDDGTEGWVSASLVGVETPPQSTEEANQTGFNIDLDNQVAGLISDIDLYAPAQQAETPVPETTVEAGNVVAPAEATAENTVEPTTTSITDIPALPAAIPYRDERWYGMTLGLVAIIVVITIGMIANIVRGLFRRGK